MSLKSTPVTIITGFLGSGKTTLLNNIIRQNPATRFVIIENEFGEVNIDSSLVISAKENIFELSNGCICCSLNGDLADMLNKLVTGNYDYDHLIIETTGIADPSAVAAVFLTDYNVQTVFKLDGVVCLVDASNILAVLGVEEEASKQIGFSDYLILNKIADAGADTLLEVQSVLQKINPFAEIVMGDFAEINTKEILNLKAYNKDKIEFKLSAFLPKQSYILQKQQFKHNNIVSQSFTITESFDLLKLRHYLTVMLFIQGSFFYRIKGILNIEGLKRKLIIQSVKGSPVFSDGDDWKSDEPRVSKIVFIGKNLKREIFEKGLKQCYFKTD